MATQTNQGYKLPSKAKMISELHSEYFKQSMRSIQIQEIDKINRDFLRKGYICDNETKYVTQLYIDIVLNSKRFNSQASINKRAFTPQDKAIAHPGMMVALRYYNYK